eukprot:c609_g1_i1.p1 GENE.c609_g1_i1~~c609_g1_i1.p1  ORF type:complete len:150 (+),score=32.29 c609_g1_i1:44-451(+)
MDDTNTDGGEGDVPEVRTSFDNDNDPDRKMSTSSVTDNPRSKVVIKDGKVVIMFRATGNAPILRQQKFKISASESFQAVGDFLRRQLRMKNTDSLFLFCNSGFSPAPDAVVGDLAQCFHLEGCLVVNYCLTAAWG